MTLTEPNIPPPEYLPERVFSFLQPRKPKPAINGYLAHALYKGWAHDSWAFRHWRTPTNQHVEHWHGVSRPGGVK